MSICTFLLSICLWAMIYACAIGEPTRALPFGLLALATAVLVRPTK